MRRPISLVMAGLLGAMVYSDALADGVDAIAYLTRVGSSRSPLRLVGGLTLLMIVNYSLNLVVIGFPAARYGPTRFPTVAISVVWLTLLGQVADRVGALLAGVVLVPLVWALGSRGEGGWILPLLGLNFLFSGLAVVLLARYFLRRRWGVTTRASWAIAVIAGVVTNPAWALALWFA